MLQLIVHHPSPLILYILTYFFVLKGNEKHHRNLSVCRGFEEFAEISSELQRYPTSRHTVVGPCCESSLVLEGCKKWLVAP